MHFATRAVTLSVKPARGYSRDLARPRRQCLKIMLDTNSPVSCRAEGCRFRNESRRASYGKQGNNSGEKWATEEPDRGLLLSAGRWYILGDLLLTYRADRRTLAYMTITTALIIVQWNLAAIQPIIYLWFLFMGVSVAIIAHNHNHLPIWKSRFLNILTDYWLTLFYGFPAFVWIPTHNKNHHFLNNKKGDYTITYRVSEKNNIFTLLSYPSISSYFQQKPIANYLRTLWRNNRPKFYLAASQYIVLGIYYAVAIFVLDWKKAFLFIVIPHQV